MIHVFVQFVEMINFKTVYPSMSLKYKIISTARGLNLVGRESDWLQVLQYFSPEYLADNGASSVSKLWSLWPQMFKDIVLEETSIDHLSMCFACKKTHKIDAGSKCLEPFVDINVVCNVPWQPFLYCLRIIFNYM